MHKRDLSTGATPPSPKRPTNLARRTGGPPRGPPRLTPLVEPPIPQPTTPTESAAAGSDQVPMKQWKVIKKKVGDAAQRAAVRTTVPCRRPWLRYSALKRVTEQWIILSPVPCVCRRVVANATPFMVPRRGLRSSGGMHFPSDKWVGWPHYDHNVSR